MKRSNFKCLAFDLSPYILGSLIVGCVVIYQYGFYLLEFIGYPLGYSGDGLFTMAIAKMFSENGIFFGSYTEQLNYPYSSDLDAWYPIPEKLVFYPFAFLVKLFGIFSATNIIQLLTHLLSAIGFIFAARFMGVTRKYAFLGGVVFGLTPFIFSRGLAHLTVGATWFVPLMSVVILKLMEQLGDSRKIENKLKWAAIACAGFGIGLSPYYSFMYGQFLGFILLVSLLKKEFSLAKFVFVLILIMVVGLIFLNISNLINVFLFTSTSVRNLPALEVYGLKLPELFLPAGFNRLGVLADFAQQNYYVPAFVKGELWSPYLGLVGIVACIYFVSTHFYERLIKDKNQLDPLLLQSIWISFYSLIGGVNLLVGVMGFQYIRATNRYSIWLLAIFLLYTLHRLSQKKNFNKRYVFIPCVLITFTLIWLDLPQAYNTMTRSEISKKIVSDQQLVAYLKSSYMEPKVYTLPQQVFPENGPTNQMIDYDFLRLYLNSNNIKMSYGGVKLDKTTPIYSEGSFIISKYTLDSLVESGFNFIVINKSGYLPNELKEAIKKLNEIAIKADFENEFFIVFRLPDNNIRTSKFENSPKLMYTSGWSSQEPGWRWAISNKATIKLYCNQLCENEIRNKKLIFDLKSFGASREIKVNVGNQIIWKGVVDKVTRDINIPAHFLISTQKQIEITTSGKLITPGGGDRRHISFGIENVRFE